MQSEAAGLHEIWNLLGSGSFRVWGLLVLERRALYKELHDMELLGFWGCGAWEYGPLPEPELNGPGFLSPWETVVYTPLGPSFYSPRSMSGR